MSSPKREKWSEAKLDFMEQQIPFLMMAAVTIARYETLAAGLSVVQLEGDDIIEQFPDGTKRVIRKLKENNDESL